MTRRRQALAWAIAPALVIQLATAPTASGRVGPPTGGPVTTLSTHGLDPVTVVDREGTATAVWATDDWRGPIMAARRPPGEGWSRPVSIGRGTGPLIGVDAAGIVTVLFSTNRRGFTTGLSAVRREPGRPWGTPKHLTRDRRADRYTPDGDEGWFGAHRADLAVSPAGDVIAVWQWGSHHRHRPYRIESARRPIGGLWSEPRGLTRRNWSHDPEVGIDRSGRATLVYELRRSLVSRRFVPGGGWAGQVPLRGSAAVVDYELVVAPRGDTALMLYVFHDSRGTIAIMRRPLAGPWLGTLRLSPDGAYAIGGAITVDGTNAVSVAWTRRTGRVDVVRWEAGAWSPMLEISGPAQNHLPQVAGNNRGALVVWWQNESLGIRARTRDRNGTWSPRFRLWPDAESYLASRAALYPDGDVLGVVQRRDNIRARQVHLD